jgi:hypothetical protein
MNITQELCPKPMTIYHIVGKKVGSSSNLKRRMSNQGYTVDDCEVLHEIEPNTMPYRAIWELECQEQARLGYQVEHEQNWKIFLRQHTNHNTKDPAVRAKMSAIQSDGRQAGSNNPMYGRTGEANPMFGRTGEASPTFSIKPPNTKAYNILNLDGDLFAYTDDPTGFAKQHGLHKGALRECANPRTHNATSKSTTPNTQ